MPLIRDRLGSSDVCGNDVVEESEECDDGNNFGGDGCNSECVLETCSDGILNQDEELVDCGGVCGECDSCVELDNSIFFEGNYSQNYCKDDFTLIEFYCGINIFRWDFWNINERVAKSREVNCELGCEFEFGECIIDGVLSPVINNTDLPLEPELPPSL